MQVGYNMAWSEAIRCVKENTMKYLAVSSKPIKIDSQIKDKGLHGLHDHEFGWLLILADNVEEWDVDLNG